VVGPSLSTFGVCPEEAPLTNGEQIASHQFPLRSFSDLRAMFNNLLKQISLFSNPGMFVSFLRGDAKDLILHFLHGLTQEDSSEERIVLLGLHKIRNTSITVSISLWKQ